MNKSCVFLVAGLCALPATAAETQIRSPAPQPRVRLDPNSHTAIPAPKEETRPSSADPVIAMSPFIVRSTAIAAEDPQQEQQPNGPFSLLGGGWAVRKDGKRLRFEVGAWPYRNLLWKTDRFKSDLRHNGTEFIRVTW